jgi:hypothetical protein
MRELCEGTYWKKLDDIKNEDHRKSKLLNERSEELVVSERNCGLTRAEDLPKLESRHTLKRDGGVERPFSV